LQVEVELVLAAVLAAAAAVRVATEQQRLTL
jgi:hypothetical protein